MEKRRIWVLLLWIFALATPSGALAEDIWVVPGGQSVGVAVTTQGLVVIGNSDLGSLPSPARLSGLRPGDRILSVDGEPVTGAEHLLQLMENRETLELSIERDGNILSLDVSPAIDPRDGVRRLGAWVRDSAAGVGTLSFYDPETLRYGALGHAITDVDTGTILSVENGLLFDSAIVDIHPGKAGEPGELIGQFSVHDAPIGDIQKNTEFGVFGQLREAVDSPYASAIPLAEPDGVKTGQAQLLTTLDDGGVQAYDCEIIRRVAQREPALRGVTIRVTDPALIAATGGIAQGMSGSPIVQDGRLVAVVTHVYLSDPQQGYAVYAKWMYDEMAA